MNVYIEQLLIENLIINYIILYATKVFTKTYTSKKRVFVASLIGAVYTLIVFFPYIRVTTKITTKIIVAIIITIVAFNPKNLRSFLRLIATFHLVAFTFAGTCLALLYIIDIDTNVENGVFYISNFKMKTLIMGIMFAWILFQIVLEYLQNKSIKSKSLMNIKIDFRDIEINVEGIVDTGNSLKDPITKTPVIVVEYCAIKEILPHNIQEIFYKYKCNDLDLITDIMYNNLNKVKFTLIPFKSLGKEDGMLIGFRPDKITLNTNEETKVKEVVIGIYNGKLSNNDDYKALIHPDILT